MPGVLEGIRVLDLSRALAGPFAAMTLGDMGADVIKVEDPAGGDTTRGFTPFWNGESTYFLSANRNKRGMTLNLATVEGQDIVRQLAHQSDLLVENFKPRTMERWGLGSVALLAKNPRLIWCSVTAVGADGPDKDRAGVDLLMQAYGGLMSITGEPDRLPVRSGVSMVDLATGSAAAQGILAALYSRERTGRGQRVDVSLLGTTIQWLMYHAVAWFATGENPQRMGSRHPSVAPYGTFPTRDGFLVVAIAFDSHWRKFCEAAGRPDLATDDRLAKNPDRIANRAYTEQVVAEILAERSAQEWADVMDAAGVPCSPINNLDRVLTLPQAMHQEYVADLPHPDIPELRMPGISVKFSETPSSLRLPPPKLGEHTEEVLGALGYDRAGIANLRARGAI